MPEVIANARGAGTSADWGMIQDVTRYSKSLEELRDAPDAEVLSASRKLPDAFAILISRYEAAFLRRAEHILRSREDAEEVVQDTFTRIYLYADRYAAQEGAQFSSWAYTILTRLCYTRYQKLKKERGRMLEMEPEAFERIPEAQGFLEELSLKHEVLDALSRVPESCARLLRLQFLEGKTQEEIAALEGSTVPAVKTRVFRAKKAVKEALANRTYD
jgi:RNA polymerase sigma-70 factor (ECF subfamily)